MIAIEVMLRWRKIAIALIVLGVLVHPLGALCAAPFARVPLEQLASPGSDLFGIGMALPPFLAVAAVAFFLAPTLDQRRARRAAFVLTSSVLAILSLAAQEEAWRGLGSDAQSAIAFAILPIGAGLVALLVGVVSFVVAAVVGARPPKANGENAA